MSAEVIRVVEQFLYREARLLDERRFHDWLELFTDDLRYWMPVRTSRYRRGAGLLSSSTRTGTSKKSWPRKRIGATRRDKQSLSRRIARLDTGMAWAEDRPRAPVT